MAYFLKKTLFKGREKRGRYLQIYEGHHDPDKGYAVQTSVKVLGYEEDLRKKGIEDPVSYAQDEVDRLNAARNEEKANVRKIGKSGIRYCGYFLLKAVMNTLDVKRHFDLLQLQYDMEYNVYDLFTALVYARAVKPCSKKKTFEEVLPYMYEYADAPWSYDQIRDCCEYIGRDMDRTIEILNAAVRDKYGIDTSSTFFDCTNFYFEIDNCRGPLWKGPSKENRHDPIIGMGLLLDRNQIPIGMKMYPGNRSEIPVFRKVLSEMKSRFNAHGRTIRVADKGLNCADNIYDSIQVNDGYIFSKSVPKLSSDEKAWVFKEDEPWTDVYEEDDKGNKTLHYRYRSCQDSFTYTRKDEDGKKHDFSVVEKRVLTYNPSLARKKTIEIKRMMDKATTLCTSQAKKEEYGESSKYVKFLSVKKNGEVTEDKIITVLNNDAYEKDLREAGYNMIVTSELYMDPQQIYGTYHRLWRIEETFRIMKSELDARPVFLQDENRIYGHFVICYTAVLLLRILELKILKDRIPPQRLMAFIRGYIVMDMDGQKCLNATKIEHMVSPLKAVFEFPLDNYYLSKAELRKLFAKKINAIDAGGNIVK